MRRRRIRLAAIMLVIPARSRGGGSGDATAARQNRTASSRQAPCKLTDGVDLLWVVSSPATDIVRVELSGNLTDLTGYGIDDLSIDAGDTDEDGLSDIW